MPSRHLDSKHLCIPPFVRRSNIIHLMFSLPFTFLYVFFPLVNECLTAYITVFARSSMVYSYYVAFFDILMQLAFCINIMLGNKTTSIHSYSGCSSMLLRFSFRILRIETHIFSATARVGY